MVAGNPIVRRRQLGRLLAEARERAKLTREAAGEAVELPPSTIGRLERGQAARVRLRDVRGLLDLYGVTDKGFRATCETLALSLREAGWWEPFKALPEEYRRLLGLEAAASETRYFQSAVVPGVLQTPDYARSVIRAAIPAVPPDVMEERVSLRLARQERALAHEGPRIHVVMDEGALLRQVGGSDVWKAQLTHLAFLVADAPRNLLVQVLRFDSDAPPMVSGSFMLLRLRDSETDAWIAYTETPTGDHYEEGRDADIYTAIFDHLTASAVSPKETVEILEKHLATWG